MIYLYGAVDEPAKALNRMDEQFRGHAVTVEAGSVAVVGRCSDEQLGLGPDEQNLRDHDAVVRQLMQVSTVVPFRFGTVVADPSDLRRRIAGRENVLAGLLRFLAGRVELAVRARPQVDDLAPRARISTRSGRAYLRMLADDRALPGGLAGFHQELAAAAVAATAASDDRHGLKAAYLVDQDEIDGFCRLVTRAASRWPSLSDVSVTGPWPPYSFVEDRLAAAHAPSGQESAGG